MMTRFFSRAASVVLLASALTLGLGLNTAHAVDANNPDTVERQVSLVFLGEMYDEDEKNQSPAGEFWDEPAPFELVVRRYKNTYTLGYSVEIIDPEPLSHPLAVDSLKKISRFSGGSKFSNSDSISNPDYCKGLSDLVSPGTEPGRFRTKVHCTSPFVATVESGYFFVSKLDAHGDSSSSSSSSSSAAVSANTRAKFPDDTQCLPKRKGTVYEPVIQIDKGGVTYPLGKPSLYGLVSPAGADPKPANKWQFTAVAKDPETNENMPFGFDYRWTVSSKAVITTVTRQSATFEETIEATYGIGRFYPKLEIWKTHERVQYARGAYIYTALTTPVLVAKAEIHSLAVENTPTDNVVAEVFDRASAIFGTRCMVSNDVGGSGQAVDAKMEIVGSGDIRGRVTLDGYPQNEYWATSADNEDLYQVDQCIEGATSIRIQGYKKPSASDHDLTLKVAGQTFIEACIADYRFKGGPVNWSWTPTDSEPFMSSWMVKVPDATAVNPPEPQPPVAAATGSTVTVRFEKFVNIAPAPSGSSSSTSTTGAVAGDFIRFVLKDGSDVTQTLADYLANVNAPQTRKAKIAITGQRYQGNKLELDLEIGPDVSVGWYHADAKWGADHAYVSSETVYGSSGTFRMKEALGIYKLTPRKYDDGGIVSALDNNDVPISTPNPVIKMGGTSFAANTVQSTSGQLSGTFTVSGSLSSWMCDLTEGTNGTIDHVDVYLNHDRMPIASIPVQVTKGSGTAPRKYPFAGSFSAVIPVAVKFGPNTFTLRAKDKVIGKIGSAEVLLDCRSNAPADPSPVNPASGGFAQYVQPFVAETDLTGLDIDSLVGENTKPPVITIAASDPTASEVGPNTGAFTVTRTGSTAAPLTVSYMISGTATQSDYIPLSGSVQIPAGALSALIVVTPVIDTLSENNETVAATIQPSTAYRVGVSANATVTIRSGGIVGDIVMDVVGGTPEANVITKGKVGKFIVTRFCTESAGYPAVTRPWGTPIQTSGTAVNGVDYILFDEVGNPVIGAAAAFLPGQTQRTFTVQVLNDTLSPKAIIFSGPSNDLFRYSVTMYINNAPTSGLENSTATLPITVRSLISNIVPVTASLTRKTKSLRGLLLVGDGVSLGVTAQSLRDAVAGSINSFIATIDCSTITRQERQVIFRRTTGNRFVTDYYRLQLSAPSGFNGLGPISASVSRGANGLPLTKSLSLVNGQWKAADASLTIGIVTSSSADGIRGITASVTCPSFGLVNFPIQATAGSGGSDYSSDGLQPIDMESNTDGSLYADYPDVEWQDDAERFQALALEVEGPAPLLNNPDFRIQVRSGDRKVITQDGKTYLANDIGGERDTLVLLPRHESPVDSLTDFFDSVEEGALASGEFLAGFVVGFTGGGADLISTTGQLIGNAFIHVGASLWYYFPNTDTGKFARQIVQKNVETVYKATSAVADSLSKIVQAYFSRRAEIEVALITGDRAKLVEIVGEYADLLEFGSEIMADILDVYAGQPPYEQGKMFGGAIFEIASFIIPAAKAGSLANIAKATAMASIIEKIRAAAWFAKMPEAGKAKVIGALDKLSAFVAKLATTKMCFVAGTPIQTADGLRAIETITPGDSVWSRNPETGDMAYRPVISTTVTHPTTLHHIVYRAGNARRAHAVGAASAVATGEDGGSDDPPGSTSELVCTGEHPFFIQEKHRFVEARSLQIGDSLMLADRSTATVVSNTTEAAPDGHTFTTYNFEVAEFHTYFVGVGGVWVHNAGRECERILTLYARLKERLNLPPMEVMEAVAKKLPKANGRAIADSWVAASKEQHGIVHIDIAGEGRYPDAINVNHQGLTSTTGAPGQPIPHLVKSGADALPFDNSVVDKFSYENFKVTALRMSEVKRVSKPGAEINILNPKDLAIGGGDHELARSLLGGQIKSQVTFLENGIEMTRTIIIIP